MDGFFTYQALQQQSEIPTNFEISSIKNEINKRLEEKKEEVIGAVQPISETFIADGTRGLIKYGFNKIKSKGGRGAKLIEKAEQLKQDYKEGGLKKMFQKETDRISNEVKESLENKAKEASTKIEGQLNNDARTTLSKYAEDLDTTDDNPFGIPDDIQESKVISSQFIRNKEALDNNIQENQKQIKPQEDPTEIEQPKDISSKMDVDEAEDIGKDVSKAENIGKDAEEVEDIGKSVGSSLEEASETDAVLGGPEDPIGDIISVGIGIAGLIGGIFGAHRMKAHTPKLPLPAQPSVQIGA